MPCESHGTMMTTLRLTGIAIQQPHLTRITLILAGETLGDLQPRSQLYHTTYAYIFRRRSP